VNSNVTTEHLTRVHHMEIKDECTVLDLTQYFSSVRTWQPTAAYGFNFCVPFFDKCSVL